MPAQKNTWLNAKPVTRTGGSSGGVRNPKKPYKKPAKPAAEKPARWDAKTKSERLQEAGKTKPNSPAPKQVMKKPVTRTGPVKGPVPPKGSTGPIKLPNSQRAGVNLPQTGARAERTATRAIKAKAASAPKPSPATTAKPPAAASSAANAASRAAGMAGRVAGAFGTALMIPAAIKNIADVAERNRQWDAYKERMGMNKPKPTTTSSSSTPGRRTGSNNRNANLSIPTSPAGTRAGAAAGTRTRSRTAAKPAPSGPDWRSRVGNSDVNALRQGQNDAIRSYGDKPAPSPKPPSTQSGSGSTQSRSGGSTGARTSAPAAPRRQPQATQPTQTGPKRVSASTYNREQGNYGTSRTNNPMIDAEMKARMRQREDREGVGPTKDGSRYAADLKNSTQGVGPVANSDNYGSILKQKSGIEKLKEAQAKLRDEQQRRRRYTG